MLQGCTIENRLLSYVDRSTGHVGALNNRFTEILLASTTIGLSLQPTLSLMYASAPLHVQ